MNQKETSLRRLRLERLEGRWLMSADAFHWLVTDGIQNEDASQTSQRQNHAAGSGQIQSGGPRHGQSLSGNSDRSPDASGRTPRVDAISADCVFRERDLEGRDLNDRDPNGRGSRHGSLSPVRPLIVDMFAPISPNVGANVGLGGGPSAGPTTGAPANGGTRGPGLPSSVANNVFVATAAANSLSSSPLAANVTFATSPFVGRELATRPFGEPVVTQLVGTDVSGEISGANSDLASGSSPGQTLDSGASALSQFDTLVDDFVIADQSVAGEDTFLVSLTVREFDAFELATSGLQRSDSDSTSSSFLDQVDEAILQTGLDQWLSDAETFRSEAVQLDQLLHELAISELASGIASRHAGLEAFQTGRELADDSRATISNAWVDSIGQMILMVPNAQGPRALGDADAPESNASSVPWAAGIGLHRAFDFAGADTQFDDAIASVSVPVDSGAWNLAGPMFGRDHSVMRIVQTPILSLNTSAAIGVAVGVLGIQYFRGRYRLTRNGLDHGYSYITNVGAGRAGGQ